MNTIQKPCINCGLPIQGYPGMSVWRHGTCASLSELPNPWTTGEVTPAAKTTLPDSGVRETKANGFMREPEGRRPNYVPLLTARGIEIVPEELIIRIAEHYYQGGLKYAPDNWRKGTDRESLERNRRSAARHFAAWLRGETDEDHLAAATWNMITHEINKSAAKEVAA